MSYLFDTKYIGDYRIDVLLDENAECPCIENDMLGIYLWAYSDFSYDPTLHNSCSWKEVYGRYGTCNHTIGETLSKLVSKYVSQRAIVNYIKSDKCKNLRIRYDNHRRIWVVEYYAKLEFSKTLWHSLRGLSSCQLKTEDWREELCDYLDKDDLLSLLHDCKKIAFYEWSSSGSSQGDYVSGYAFCDKQRFIQRGNTITKNWRRQALEIFEKEVECIGMWMWANVKRFELYKKIPYKKCYVGIDKADEDAFDWEIVDSCGGFYMETEDVIDMVVSENNLQPKDAA